MRILQIPLHEITFIKTPYTTTLYQSLQRVGLNFPIRITKDTQGYCCIDGHKRLSAIADMQHDQNAHRNFQSVACILITSRSAPPAYLRNHH